MAVREFQGVILNQWDDPLIGTGDEVDSGDWQDPWYPSRVPGCGRIQSAHDGEWRSESDGIATGTSGWARWVVRVFDVFANPAEHFEWVQVNWRLPFVQTHFINVTCEVFRNNPAGSDAFSAVDTQPPSLEIVPMNDDRTAIDGVGVQALYTLTIPASWFVYTHQVSRVRVNFVVRRRIGAQASPLTFPTGLPTRQESAMAAFRNRAQSALPLGFAAGFPNFYETTQGRDHLGGTVLIRSAGAE